MKKLLTYLLLFPFLLNAQHEKDIKALDSYVQQGMNDWKVPGLSIAVVKDGKQLFSKGYGVLDVESQTKVTSDSRFMIGSTTKAMTATALAILVDEGKINWNDKVIDHYPKFQLFDAYATRDVTIIDLLTHRAGLGNADFLWSLNDISSEEIVERLKLLEPAYSLRAGYTYQNIMYLVAGFVIEKVSSQPWASFVNDRIFEPLEMTRTRALYADLENEDGYVKPHHLIDGKATITNMLTADKVAPAGSVWSTSDDMTNWMLMLLDSGNFKGKRIVSKERIADLWKTYTIIPKDQFYPTTQITKPNWTTYGLGFFQHDYQGYQLQFHTGSLPGLTAIIGLVPERDFGVYVFGNLDHAELRHALMYKAIDLFLGFGETDWNKEFLDLYGGIQSANEKRQEESFQGRNMDTSPSLELSEYVGVYSDPLYGKVEVSMKDGVLNVKFNSLFSASLSHWHYDTFKGDWNQPYSTPNLFTFTLNDQGQTATFSFNGITYRRDKD
ncbi:MAG: serine hydrolase [Cyclobacteriaceae bacterium]